MTHLAISVHLERCTGCQRCTLACSKRFEEGKVRPSVSRIRVFNFFPALDIPTVCWQCEDENPPCWEACPIAGDIFSRDENTNAVLIDEKTCTGCGQCIDACPANAIWMHPETNKALKCDLCGGNPQCVKACPVGALELSMTPFSATHKNIKAAPEDLASDLRKKLIGKEEVEIT